MLNLYLYMAGLTCIMLSKKCLLGEEISLSWGSGELDKKTERICDLLTLVVTSFIFIPLIIINQQHRLELSLLALLFFCSLLVRSFFFSERLFDIGRWEKLMLFGEFLLITGMVYFDISGISQIYYYILIADVVLFYTFRFALFFSMLLVLSPLLLYYAQGYFTDWSHVMVGGMIHSTSFIFVFLLFCMLRHQIEQRNIIARTRAEVENRNKKLEEAFRSLEEMTVLQERNRIAREVHDTTGHTLTTALMGVEASRRLLGKDSGEADRRMGLVQGQIKKGLKELRESIIMINNHQNIIDLEGAVRDLLGETRRQTGLDTSLEISVVSSWSTGVKKVLLRALQEGITNAIKHGGCSELGVELQEDGEGIKLFLQDDGRGAERFSYGFGLSFMEERLQELGGSLAVRSGKGDGFQLAIRVPREGNTDGDH